MVLGLHGAASPAFCRCRAKLKLGNRTQTGNVSVNYWYSRPGQFLQNEQ